MGGPSMTIETITVTRPMKVIAFTCCFITVFLMIAACSTSDWVTSAGWHEGLFKQCADKGALTPLPFEGLYGTGCARAHSAGYIKGTAALIIIVCMMDFFGTLMTGLGLRSTDPNKKYKYYRVAIYAFTLALLTLFLALIIYPVSLSKDINRASPYDGYKVTNSKNDLDFDNDGILDHLDDDDDNDGIIDSEDTDDDNDGIADAVDDDDDNDGIPDNAEKRNDNDYDNDGIIDSEDTDDDNDGIPDVDDNDDDNDGTPDHLDTDDDNDGIPDADEDEVKDTDGDGITDDKDMDIDNDGIENSEDNDDDNDGIVDALDFEGRPREWSFGFGYGVSWASGFFIFMSLILLVCDRESEEIFYKERPCDEEEGGDDEEEDEK